MNLSPDQMRAVEHGFHNRGEYEFLELPIGPRPLPEWAKGLHVDFMLGYINSPHVYLKITDQRLVYGEYDEDGTDLGFDGGWKFFDGAYFTHSEDGRAKCHYHGPLEWRTMERFIGYAKDNTGQSDYRHPINETYQAWATIQSDGYSGRTFKLKMKNGTVGLLRGPWHGLPPKGYVEVYTNAEGDIAQWNRNPRSPRPWWNCGGTFGLYISDDLFLRLMAKFEPTFKVARVTSHRYTRLEPVFFDWSAPKDFISKEEQERAR